MPYVMDKSNTEMEKEEDEQLKAKKASEIKVTEWLQKSPSQGKPLKSSLKSSASAPSAPSLPSAPQKNVHFPSRDGELESVRVFQKSNRPASISVDTEELFEPEFPFDYLFFPTINEERRYEIDKKNSSPVPAVGAERAEGNVYFESLGFIDKLHTLTGTILVRNIAFHKSVNVRFTLDDWQTTSEVRARHDKSLAALPRLFLLASLPLMIEGDGEGSEGRREVVCRPLEFGDVLVEGGGIPVWDRFRFEIRLEGYERNIQQRTMWIAVRYTTASLVDGGGTEWWDNNSGNNYRIGFVKRVVEGRVEEGGERKKREGMFGDAVHRRNSAPPEFTASVPFPATSLESGEWSPTLTNSALPRSPVYTSSETARGDHTLTWTIMNSVEEYREMDACPLFSVQSFEPQAKGLSSDIIVTVGMPCEDPIEPPLFNADYTRPSTPTRSIRRLSFHSSGTDDFSDRISEYWSSADSTATTSRTGRLNFRIDNSETSRDSSFCDGNSDRLSVFSRETFETAEEPPPELFLALGLHLDISSQTPLPTRSEPSFVAPPVRNGGSRREEEQSMDSENPNVHSPMYNISFIRDVSNVCIIGSHINFTTNIMHNDDHLLFGLHTLYLRSDPTALHSSYERQKWLNQQMKVMHAWGSQLLITSSSALGEYPLSVPSIKTRDLEQVVKDVFTWLFSASSQHSIMWLHEESEEEVETSSCEGNNIRTSLVGQCLADFFGERRDLTASYFYAKQQRGATAAAAFPQAGTSHFVRDGKDHGSSIIPTIAYELTRRIPEIEMPIALTAAKELWIFDLSLDEQMKKLIVDPLQAAAAASNNHHVKGTHSHSHSPPRNIKFPQLFLIHGLEDCDDDDFQELFLLAFGRSLARLRHTVPQKLMLLGRHTAHLRQCFSRPEIQEIVQHRLLPLSKDVVV